MRRFHLLPDMEAAEHLILPNSYRIGDSVAVMTLRAWVERRFGEKAWYLRHPNGTLPLLTEFTDTGWKWLPESAAPDEAAVFDDVNLWIWNDIFYRTGHRIDCIARRERFYRVVFAPLLEADYAVERTLHPTFALEIARYLSRIPDALVLLPKTVNTHDLRAFATLDIPQMICPLREAIHLIGSAELFIGCDTGLSHIAGCFPNVAQIALHDRANTAAHNEGEFDHLRTHREHIAQLAHVDGNYRSTPNKRNCTELFFDHGGMDGESLKKVLREIDRKVFHEKEETSPQ